MASSGGPRRRCSPRSARRRRPWVGRACSNPMSPMAARPSTAAMPRWPIPMTMPSRASPCWRRAMRRWPPGWRRGCASPRRRTGSGRMAGCATPMPPAGRCPMPRPAPARPAGGMPPPAAGSRMAMRRDRPAAPLPSPCCSGPPFPATAPSGPRRNGPPAGWNGTARRRAIPGVASPVARWGTSRSRSGRPGSPPSRTWTSPWLSRGWAGTMPPRRPPASCAASGARPRDASPPG